MFEYREDFRDMRNREYRKAKEKLNENKESGKL